jgi:hypothetical protein
MFEEVMRSSFSAYFLSICNGKRSRSLSRLIPKIVQDGAKARYAMQQTFWLRAYFATPSNIPQHVANQLLST